MYREPTVKGRKPGLKKKKQTSLEQKEEINIQSEKNKETIIYSLSFIM